MSDATNDDKRGISPLRAAYPIFMRLVKVNREFDRSLAEVYGAPPDVLNQVTPGNKDATERQEILLAEKIASRKGGA